MALSAGAFAAALRTLQAAAPGFDDAAHARKQRALQRLQSLPLPLTPALARYHDGLLFLAAHPADAAQRALVDSELRRVAATLRAARGRIPPALHGRGLPWAPSATRFSHDAVRWLLARSGCRVAIDGFHAPRMDLSEVLRLTLPSTERAPTTAGLDNLALLDALGVRPADRLRFVVDQLAALDAQPLLKDLLWDALDLHVRLQPTAPRLATAFNRLDVPRVFHQRTLLRRFDPLALMNRPLPPPRALDAPARERIAAVVRSALVLTLRETDPGTYTDLRSLQVFDLEHGLAVALFGMTPDRQLPLESYVGFMLFKNGLAAAYGGAWLFGARADFGMNVFEPFRGGESGFVMCQLLRTYRQAFGLERFEVDAHQFGLDNPDGIASGAFWFYWKHGFRPVDAALRRRAEREAARLARYPGARSAPSLLRAFTGSNVALEFGGAVPPPLADFTERITRHLQRAHRGDRAAAVAEAVRDFVAATGTRTRNDDERRVLAEVALLAAALRVGDAAQLARLRRLVRLKPADLTGYQRLLGEFLPSVTP